MCGGPGGMCGMSPSAQATPMQGMMPMPGMAPGQQAAMPMGCCPMMQRAAASVDARLRQLEERAGIPAPAQPAPPHSAH